MCVINQFIFVIIQMAQTKLDSLAWTLVKVCTIVGIHSPFLDDFDTLFEEFNATFGFKQKTNIH